MYTYMIFQLIMIELILVILRILNKYFMQQHSFVIVFRFIKQAFTVLVCFGRLLARKCVSLTTSHV